MMISAGEFWVADIPYTNQTASKKRPVLVLWPDAADVVVAAVTTSAPRSLTDVSRQLAALPVRHHLRRRIDQNIRVNEEPSR